VKENEIENLRILIKELEVGEIMSISDNLEEGELVEVLRGPFKGLKATSVTFNGKHRVIVHIESLGNNFVINIPRSYINKVFQKVA
jgi:transcription antitermination factor NusG